jgi:hypothetical protein
MSDPSRSGGSLQPPDRLRIYVDADVLLAGAASPADHSASQVILSLSEITLIGAITSELAVEECTRNLEANVPDAVSTFDLLAERALKIVPVPSLESVRQLAGWADWKDAAHRACTFDQAARISSPTARATKRPATPTWRSLGRCAGATHPRPAGDAVIRRREHRSISTLASPAFLDGARRVHHRAHAAEVVLHVIPAEQRLDHRDNAELNASASAFLLPWSLLRLAVRLRCELRQIR